MIEFKKDFIQGRYLENDYLPECTPVWTNNVGIIKGKGKPRFWWHGNFFSMHILSRGKGYVKTEFGLKSLQKGDMFCLLPDMEFEYFRDNNDPWEVYWINLCGEQAGEFAELCGFQGDKYKLTPVVPDNVIEYFRRIFDNFLEVESKPYAIVADLYKILENCRGEEVPRKFHEKLSFQEILINRVKSILESRQNLSINVMELAAEMQVSRSALYQAFKEILNISPIDYIINIRITRAKHLLLNTSFNIAVIAEMSGFGQVKYFQRCFKKWTGIPPGKWRQQKNNS